MIKLLAASGAAALAIVATDAAAINKCIDKKGKVSYQEAACPVDVKAETLRAPGSAGGESEKEAAADAKAPADDGNPDREDPHMLTLVSTLATYDQCSAASPRIHAAELRRPSTTGAAETRSCSRASPCRRATRRSRRPPRPGARAVELLAVQVRRVLQRQFARPSRRITPSKHVGSYQQRPADPDKVLVDIVDSSEVQGPSSKDAYEELRATASSTRWAAASRRSRFPRARRCWAHRARHDRPERREKSRGFVPARPVQAAFTWHDDPLLDFNDTWLAAECDTLTDNLGGILMTADWLSRNAGAAGKPAPHGARCAHGHDKAHEIQESSRSRQLQRVGLDHVVLVKSPPPPSSRACSAFRATR